MKIFESDKPIELSEHIGKTYRTLRIALVVIALLFPWVLGLGGYYLTGGQLRLQRSMSDYYHANADPIGESSASESAVRERQLGSGRGVMRNWFVGVLFAISALLAAYKGYRPAEDVALNLAAVFAVLTAIVPNQSGTRWHGYFAIAFFLCIAYVCIFCASATLSLIEKQKQGRYRLLYTVWGVGMVVSPIAAAILNVILRSDSYTFIAEALGVYAFAGYWLVKTIEISKTEADLMAARGELILPAGTGPADAVRQLQVEKVEPDEKKVEVAEVAR